MILGAQAYNIRAYTQNERDFRESMRRVAQIGYKTIQLSAVGALDPHILRSACDEAGLQIVLTHTNPERMIQDPEGVIADHKILGCNYIGIGGMPERYRNAAWIDRFATDFLTPARKMRDAGMKLSYHNHNFEWERLADGRKIIDILLDSMPEDVMAITLDLYWLQAAGADVSLWIERLASRIDCVHFKDMAVKGFEQRMAVVGEGNMAYPQIIKQLQKLGTTQYVLVEQDDCYGEDPFVCLERSYKNIRQMGFIDA